MQNFQNAMGALVAIAVTTGAVARPTAATAADLSGPRPIHGYEDAKEPSEPHRYFYVRADIGIGANSIGHVTQSDLAANGGSFVLQDLADTVYAGGGIGVQLSKRFRVDLTGEYRSSSQFKAVDNLNVELADPAGTLQASTLYQGNISGFVGLLNGYWDLFHLRGFTPYVGAGVGVAHMRTSGFTTNSASTFVDAATGGQISQTTIGTSRQASHTGLAWALMAGTSLDLSRNAKLDLGYRYINFGGGVAATSSLLDCTCGTVGAPVKISDVDAHEFRVGVRWAFGDAARDVTQHSLK